MKSTNQVYLIRRFSPYFWSLLLIASLATTTVVCSALGTVIVAAKLAVQVGGHDAAGNAWRSSSDEITLNTHNINEETNSSDYPAPTYNGKLFEWQFGAGSEGFGHAIRSKVSGKLCVRFDQALLTSNMQTKEIPMRVYFALQGNGQRPTLRMRSKSKENRMFTPPQLCFSQDKLEPFAFAVDLSELFPSKNMFNIRWAGSDPKLLDNGVGNWLKIRVPFEYEGKREELEVTLTAKDSKSWLGYW